MRKMVQAPVLTDTEAKRRHLSDLSQARVSKWPNTLSALRIAKERARELRLKKEEEERVALDKIEAKRRAEERAKRIQAANEIIYSQTEKMKQARGVLMLNDTLRIRKLQEREKVRMAELEQRREELYFNQMMRDYNESGKKLKEEMKKEKLKRLEIAEIQKAQNKEFTDRYIKGLEEQYVEGQNIAKRAREAEEEEREKQREKMRMAKRINMEFKKANEDLQKLREKYAEEEAKEDLAIKKHAERKERMKNLQKSKEAEYFAIAQKKKQDMIDAAIEHLRTVQNNENQRMERQAQELRDKEDAKEQKKKDDREALWNEIQRSRQEQMDKRAERARLDAENDKVFVAKWRQELKEANDKADNDKREVRRRNIEHSKYLQKMAKIKREKDEKAKKNLLADAFDKDDDDERFQKHFEAFMPQLDPHMRQSLLRVKHNKMDLLSAFD